jgi:hypothetical protein
MAGEIIKAKTITEAIEQLEEIYKQQFAHFRYISAEEYNSHLLSEREDSDNHLNLERLGKDTEVIDLAYYKYLPDQKIAYRVEFIHTDGISREEIYFQADIKE